MIKILAIIKDTKILINNEKKIVEIRCKTLEEIDKINLYIDKVKNKHLDYSFFINLDNKFKIDNLDINDLDKFKNHINQRLKLLIQIKQLEEKKTKTNKYFYTIVASLPGKRKYIKCTIFNINPLQLSVGKYYIADGKLELGDPKFIKKNEKALGKDKDYKFNIQSIEEYEFKEKENEKKYDVSRAELHLHTSFSKNDAFITPKDIEKAFDENKLHTLAITDHGAVFAFVPYINKLKEKYKGTDKKIILGSEFYSIDYEEYQNSLYNKLNSCDKELEELSQNSNDEELENLNNSLQDLRKQRTKEQNFIKRKTISEEEREEHKGMLEEILQQISDIEENIKDIKSASKDNDLRKVEIEKEKEYLNSQLGCINDIDRDHLTVLLKSKDTEIDYRGEKITINEGLVTLYKLITMSYQRYFSAPTLEKFKKQGKRPMVPYHEIFKPEVRKHFILTSACAFGKHMKLAVEGKWDEFRKWIHNLDAVEIQPSWNNKYMVTHEDYPNINSIEDVYALHRKIYEVCKEEGVPCIITSDAHVNDKEDRIFRAKFKEGYIGLIKQFAKEEEKKNASGDDDFSVETQPFIMSYNDVIEDYVKQGFTIEQIEEMHNNSNKIAEQCVNAFDVTILPKKLFLPDFPNINAKEEVPKIVWENAIKKWSKDGTKETIHPKIIERIEEELNAVASTGYEALYMIATWSVIESEKRGYPVGSRGSCGSMIVSLCMNISENNPLPPHYYCEHCHHVEFVDTELVGLDLEDKTCPECGSIMKGDGCNIEYFNFLGWGGTKICDIDLNISDVIQTNIHKELIKMFGEDNAIKSGTQGFYQQDALIKDIFSHIPNIDKLVQNEEFDIDYMANEIQTLRTTSQHPGGILLKPKDIPFEYVTPLVNVGDKQDGPQSSFTIYHEIEAQLVKIDLLGHTDPTMLKELYDTTKYDFHNVRFNNPILYKSILDPTVLGINDKSQFPFPATTLGISEMNTDFTMQMLSEIKPKNMTDLIYFSGLSHGTGVWNGSPNRDLIMSGEKKLSEVVPVRDIIFQQLTKKYGFEPEEAFTISESVRKGKGIKKWEDKLKIQCPYWYVEILSGITYLFPKAHAVSYITNALRILHYKIYYPQQFYSAAINRYGITDPNNSTFDYIKFFNNINSIEDLQRFHSHISHSTDNPAKEKSQKTISNILWEMKLRGFHIEKPDFTSKADRCTPSKKNNKVILLPLQSISGVGPSAALDAYEGYRVYGDKLFDMSKEELEEIRITRDGKEKRAFGKKFLDAYFGEKA